MRALRSRVIRINAVVIYPLLALFIATAPQLVPWLFGPSGPGRGAGPDPHGRRDGADDQQRDALAGARGGQASNPAGFNLYRLATLAVVVFLAAPYGLNVVCVAVAAFQVITLIGSHRFMLARLAGLTVGQLVRDIGPAIPGERDHARCRVSARPRPGGPGPAEPGDGHDRGHRRRPAIPADAPSALARGLGRSAAARAAGAAELQAPEGAGAVPRRLRGTERQVAVYTNHAVP